MSPIDRDAITGVVLAGGQGRRMGGVDKGLVPFRGRRMVEHVLEAFRPQVGAVIISANRNLDEYARYGAPVVADGMPGFNGPLAGVASALQAARTSCVATVPCDSPFVPGDLVARLAATLDRERAELCVAHDGERLQPVFALLHAGLRDSLSEFLGRGGRKIDLWFGAHRMAVADFSDRPEAFLNVNRPEELRELERVPGAQAHAGS